jgi:hypothetical protein
LLNKKREKIGEEVRLKREKEQELKDKEDMKKFEDKQKNVKDRSDRVKKRELDRKKMKDDLKKRIAKQGKVDKKASKGELEFKFVGVDYADNEDDEEEKYTLDFSTKETEGVNDQTFSNEQKDEAAVKFIEKKYTNSAVKLKDFLDNENVSDEDDSVTPVAQTPKFISVPSSEDRENVYNNDEDESIDKSSEDQIKDVKVKKAATSPPTGDASKWDYFALLTDKYGYDNFKIGLDVVTRYNMLRFTEDGEAQIKNELKKVVGDCNIDMLYSD